MDGMNGDTAGRTALNGEQERKRGLHLSTGAALLPSPHFAPSATLSAR
jgi:hypothetical protein